ncbi:MAG: galactose mutarotase [Clostridia bacterium]|nr:galactose mutarotase [Clostridia bacterium]
MITQSKFGNYDLYTLKNDFLEVELISYGATIKKIVYKGVDVALGYDTASEYENGTFYIGSTIGRYGNRIQNGSFTLNGTTYSVDKNENNITCLHGGFRGLDKCLWQGEILSDNSVQFSINSQDGECGFPGNLSMKITFTLDRSALVLSYFAECDEDTVFNPTNHVYFNLDGFDGKDCREMILTLPADYYLPVDEHLIPTGEIASVENTKFNFRTPRAILEDYDHCFVFALEKSPRFAGKLTSPTSGIQMEIVTDMPGIQMYTCSGFEAPTGKGGIPLHKHQGVALETQFFPDSPNHENFPSTVLKKGEIFESETKYIFSK